MLSQRFKRIGNHIGQAGSLAQDPCKLLENGRLPVCAVEKLVALALAIQQARLGKALQLSGQCPGR